MRKGIRSSGKILLRMGERDRDEFISKMCFFIVLSKKKLLKTGSQSSYRDVIYTNRLEI